MVRKLDSILNYMKKINLDPNVFDFKTLITAFLKCHQIPNPILIYVLKLLLNFFQLISEQSLV